MAINKKLIHFEKGTSFDRELAAGNILPTSICWIKDRQQIYTHEWGLQGVPEGGQPDQILTINENGNLIWSDPNYYTKEEIDDMLFVEEGPDANGYEYVDMGEAGIWAKYPLGVTEWDSESLNNIKYFQWGDTQGYTKSQVGVDKQFSNDWNDYKWSDGSNKTMTKYCPKSEYGKDGYTDNLTTLLLEDDACAINMKGNWRMPTKEEFLILYDNCTFEWITDYHGVSGLNGQLFKLKTDESKQLFFPASGGCGNGSVSNVGTYGNFWASSLDETNSSYGYDLYFGYIYINPNYGCTRCSGTCVIGILDSTTTKKEKYLTKEEAEETYSTKEQVEEITNKVEECHSKCQETAERVEVIETDLYGTAPDANGHEYIDMGEAGIWAKYPIGLSNYNNLDSVLYFAWGETTGYTKSQIGIDKQFAMWFNDYNLSKNGSYGSSNFIKYCNKSILGNEGFTDNLTVLELEDDVAHQYMGGAWRIPTKEEYQKLLDFCDTEWTENYNQTGVSGNIFKLKTNKSKQLFLPALDCYMNSNTYGINSYWSSSLYTNTCQSAYSLTFSSQKKYIDSICRRGYGLPIIGFIPNDTITKSQFYTKEEVDSKFQPKGNYVTEDKTLIFETNLGTQIKVFGEKIPPVDYGYGYGYYGDFYVIGEFDDPITLSEEIKEE